MSESLSRIAVVGAGFTGTMFTVHLLRSTDRPIEILLFDRRGNFGRGLAYSAGNPRHLLNVRVSAMSAFEDDPQHFLRWLCRNEARYGDGSGTPPSGQAFIARAIYGAYLEDVLLSCLISARARGHTITQIAEEVVDLAAMPDTVVLTLAGGRKVEVDRAVLSLGNFPPASVFPADGALSASGRYIEDPWNEVSIDRIGPQDAVVLVGTGLTMVDVMIDLASRGHQGPVHALSRHGLLPHRHEAAPPYPSFLDKFPASVVQLMRLIRREIALAAASGYDWRSVMDTIRPIGQALWRGLSNVERRRFLRHLKPYWEVHRHRLAPSVADQIDAWRASRRLIICCGRLQEASFVDGKARLSYQRRGEGGPDVLLADWIVNCSGPACDYRRIDHPLVRNLLASGSARPDPLALGLDLTEKFELVGRDARPAGRVHALGLPTRGQLWEITAVPDLRHQCACFAQWIARDLASSAVMPE
jgi:uncharacterized NAD(P)/FAD-binding protein YdhS